jgi:small-conductance mechanosensitive channel
MKQKNGMLWLLVAALLASDVFLLTALRQKEAAQTSLAAEKVRADDLQAQLDSLKDSNAGSQDAEIARLRADNQDLPRLRNQVTQLKAANQKLTQQLKAVSDFARQQQAQLQQIAAQNQSFRITAENQARAAEQTQIQPQTSAESERAACINHLRQIDAAKQQWALENNKTADDVPTAQDIAPYIKLDANGNIPGCPSGGTYTIGAVGVPPTCSIPGHVLP